MALTDTTKQVHEAIKRSERPLIVLPEHAGVDHFTAAFGLKKSLEKMQKDVRIATAAPHPKGVHPFRQDTEVHDDIPDLHKLIIELDVSETKPGELSYDVEDDKLRIHVSPKSGMWESHHVNVQPSTYRYDLLLCIGAQDLESCGRLFRDYADFFFQTPIVNIDHSPQNEHYGHINVVDITASSCGEVVHQLVSGMDESLVDEDIATQLLAGMISNTKSFKSREVTPKTLRTASVLLEKGARRDEIVHHLYRTRSVQTLRLWGRALARLKNDPEKKIVWTLLSQQDFLHAGAHEEDLPEVIDELIHSSPDAELVLLLFENTEKHVCGILRAHPPHDAKTLLKEYAPSGNKEEARIKLADMNLVQAEKHILDSIRSDGPN